MEKEKKTASVTFRCSDETYKLILELAAAKDWTVSHFCHRAVSDLVKYYRYFLFQPGGESDGG